MNAHLDKPEWRDSSGKRCDNHGGDSNGNGEADFDNNTNNSV